MNMTFNGKSPDVFTLPARCGAVLVLGVAAMVLTGCGGGSEDVSTASNAAPSAMVQNTAPKAAALLAPSAAAEPAAVSVATAQSSDLCE
jgi:hypothetical protein